MKFVELYRDNKAAVKNTLTAMWCASPRNDKQQKYASQLMELVDKELFASENYIPLVQCMDRYESVHSVSRDEAVEIVGGLWKAKWDPYEHQYQAWKALTNKGEYKKSMVVTTGTGSGKTECFMFPLVYDLLQTKQNNEIQALFLYPLNALMEDQKDRLQELLSGTDLKFAVYNGNMPENAGSPNSTDEKSRRLAERVKEERTKYPNIIATRNEMHRLAPNIILTNPTMLEYMLLRQKDQKLFTKKSLRWIVIDETHTFSGAGAAELAMLIRRVLDAFDLDAKDIRFATSSATIGNAKTEEEQAENDQKLQKFISDITGAPVEQVELITGKRLVKNSSTTDPRVSKCREILGRNDYVTLDELIAEGETIEQKLEILDELCGLESDPLKAKVHFFYRVPNNGLRVQLDHHNDGVFEIKANIPATSNQSPYLELMRCEHCGEYFAVGESVYGSAHEYRALTKGGEDMFAFDDEIENARRMVFSLTDNTISPEAKNGDTLVRIEGNCYYTDSKAFHNGWSVIQNTQNCCPHCHSQVLGTKKRDNDSEMDDDSEVSSNAMAFRMPPAFVSRMIAPSILPHLHKLEKDSDGNENPHLGQQFISFVDSRQAAASATMQQNLEEERTWVYSRIFNELNKKRLNSDTASANEIKTLSDQLDILKKMPGMEAAISAIEIQLEKVKATAKTTVMSWMEIFELLYGQKECEWLAYQFINKSENSDELNVDDDCVEQYTKNKYVQSIMIELLGRRPRQVSAPETMGLIATVYPKLEKVRVLPKDVEEFNAMLPEEKKINLEEWKNLLKIYMDFSVRASQCVYLKLDDGSSLDIFACQRFGTKKPIRRPALEPYISDDVKAKSHYANVILLLASLINNPNNIALSDIAYNNRYSINKVLHALWVNLTETTKLLQISERYKDDKWVVDEIREEDGTRTLPYRLNVIDISFKAPDCMWLCDARNRGESRQVLRPIDTLFMGLTPYIINAKVTKPATEREDWNPYPFVDGIKDGRKITENEITEWAESNRGLLWQNGIWGEDGIFSNRLNTIYSLPNIFVQAEHTAQVDKLVSRHSQELFKQQKINVLACSTTMEMGVDLGNLELVLMTSVPPHPSNYKQRAGRSGRNDDTRSACITLCGSDAVGLRTLENPMQQLIKRQMAVPFVDLNSPQVIQRHANAFLFRSSGVFFRNVEDDKNNLGQEVIDFFTPYKFDQNEKSKTFTIRNNDPAATEVYPNDGLGPENQTNYYCFLNFLNGDVDIQYPEADLNNYVSPLAKILDRTCFENDVHGCVSRCKTDIQGVYDALSQRVGDISTAYRDEEERLLSSGKKEDAKLVVGRAVNSGYGYVLRHKFSECLSQNMLSFLATHRFTPNANMPVEVIEFNVNLRNECTNKFGFRKSNNPSYALQEAISQYAPGNTIVLENRTSVIRGILYTGQYKRTQTFKTLYSDGNDTVIDFSKRLSGELKEWPVSGKNELKLIEPVSFIPDINEDYTRVIDKNSYTQVSAQLIGAGPWQGDETMNLMAMRSNRDCCEAKILYYNEGIGAGYCFCPDCGKTVLEMNHYGSRYNYPDGMHDQTSTKDGTSFDFHYRIDRKDYKGNARGKRIRCFSKNIMRNVILGGLIQTDYCEVKIKTEKNGGWIYRNTDNDKLLITLGILLTKSFTEYIGKDRKDVSFAIMPNGHLCIFDTNPGGSGYSNQLSNKRTMMDVIERSAKFLEEATSKDALLDKYTVRYLDKLDINSAKAWLKLVISTFEEVPNTILQRFSSAKISVVEDIFKDLKVVANTNEDKVIFVNSNWNEWNYQPQENNTANFMGGLKQRLHEVRTLAISSNDVKLCVVSPTNIPFPVYKMMGQMEDWSRVYSAKNTLPSELYPVAKVGDRIYFSDDKNCNDASANWGRSSLYVVSAPDIKEFEFIKIDVNYQPHFSKKFVLQNNSNMKIGSKLLGTIVESYIREIFEEFTSHCKNYKTETVLVKYQDEHLKSIVGIVTCLQFIEHFMTKINHPFKLEFVNEEYYESNSTGSAVYNNINNDIDRNEELKRLAGEWKDDILNDGLQCQSVSISTLPKRTLPHWRFLSFECAGQELCIYPNGGIINEWFLDKSRSNKYYSVSNTSTEDDLPLFRNKEIMYDAEIKKN